jgi:hypothetical protein
MKRIMAFLLRGLAPEVRDEGMRGWGDEGKKSLYGATTDFELQISNFEFENKCN